MTKTFLTRTVSAIVAILILFAMYFYLQTTGLKLICYLAVFIGGHELTRILLPQGIGKIPQALFYGTLLLIFHVAANYPSFAVTAFSLLSVIFLMLSLFSQKSFAALSDLTHFQTKAIAGFVYLGLLPTYAYRLLDLNQGLIWFVTLLAVVFSGDVAAYLVGVLLGKHKILPKISPKKTWEGSLGGLAGSVGAGYVCSHFLPDIPLNALLITALSAGFIAQAGDFFESALKRVADVKDSGRLMPGHGGVLDRLDGVLFASPVFMLVASLFETQY